MAHSGRERHRDRAPGLRQVADTEVPAGDRIFRITDAERQQIVRCLRYIDEHWTDMRPRSLREHLAKNAVAPA